ncbi:hypothetical protein SAMN04515656_11230 [Eubacterium aggregans]|uniref:Uncharacterized protein n=1 Tax=Eubacterium aggregans TaxID=81409 RepID=A0A1H4BQ17_9FIRM|nr:hypothetical protein [Eubacterium aggregans]SEA50160.1 hypothetical protein SAMN04515656_11230 [Eubacterium aggregans]
MPETQLTRDADTLLCLMYKQYKESRNSGISKRNAKHLGSCDDIHSNLPLSWSVSDVFETCCELSRCDFLVCTFADDTVYDSWLSDAGIIYMESRFKNNLNSLLEYITKIIGCIPL